MTNLINEIKEIITAADAINAEYIMNDREIESKIETMEYFAKQGDERMVGFMKEEIAKLAAEYNEKYLTPANVEVGQGVTIHFYSDAHAGTVIKKTKTTITIQQDIATLDPNFKPEFVTGGFAGHCTNQQDQTYTYERNPNGTTYTFRWSAKYNKYREAKAGKTVTKGRREYYDWNF